MCEVKTQLTLALWVENFDAAEMDARIEAYGAECESFGRQIHGQAPQSLYDAKTALLTEIVKLALRCNVTTSSDDMCAPHASSLTESV